MAWKGYGRVDSDWFDNLLKSALNGDFMWKLTVWGFEGKRNLEMIFLVFLDCSKNKNNIKDR